VEEEDRRSLTLPASQAGKAFITPWQQHESLFFPDESSCILIPQRHEEQDFLARGRMSAAGADTTYYAYPLFLDERGYLVPLFFVEVDVQDEGTDPENKRVVVRRASTGAIKINHHLFRRSNFSEEELLAIQEDLEGSFASFAARLKAALAYLDGADLDLAGGKIEGLDPSWSGPRWVRTPILFRSSYGAYTYNLRRDLDALLRYDFLQRDALTTALGTLIAPKPDTPTTAIPKDLIELLPLNEAQEQAARAGLDEALTVITGPPGTGKSQVVVDLLASSIMSGKAVLFASKNNKAVDVVRQRLRAVLGEEFDFTLRLGNKQEMERMPEELLNRLDRLSKATPPSPKEPELDVKRVRDDLARLCNAHNVLIQTRRREKEAASAVPDRWVIATGEDRNWPYPLKSLRDHLDMARALNGETRLGLVLWLKRLFMGSTLRRRLADQLEQALSTAPPEIWVDVQVDVFAQNGYAPLVQAFDRLIAYHQWLSARDARQEAAAALDQLLGGVPYEDKLRAIKLELSRAYQALCKATWGSRVHAALSSTRSDVQRYFDRAQGMSSTRKDQFRDALEKFTSAQQQLSNTLPVWIVTSLSVRNGLPLKANLFDLVVIDEASQCDIASALPLLFRAKRAVIIGDPKQLRHISSLSEADEKRLARDTSTEAVAAEWSYRSKSLYDVAAHAMNQLGREPHFLNEHYRSHPDIIGFSNASFYNDQLRIRTDVEALRTGINVHRLGILWHPVQGRVPPSVRSAYNLEEVDATIRLIENLYRQGMLTAENISLGVVTPFRAQADRIKMRLSQAPWFRHVNAKLIVGTAHAFQGDECDIMLFSTVVGEGMRSGARRWVADTDQLLNVAITRARAMLHVIGDPEACRDAGGHLASFSTYAVNLNN